MTATSGCMMSPVSAMLRKSTQDILDRLAWLEERKALARTRMAYWDEVSARRDDEIAVCRVALRERGIVDVSR